MKNLKLIVLAIAMANSVSFLGAAELELAEGKLNKIQGISPMFYDALTAHRDKAAVALKPKLQDAFNRLTRAQQATLIEELDALYNYKKPGPHRSAKPGPHGLTAERIKKVKTMGITTWREHQRMLEEGVAAPAAVAAQYEVKRRASEEMQYPGAPGGPGGPAAVAQPAAQPNRDLYQLYMAEQAVEEYSGKKISVADLRQFKAAGIKLKPEHEARLMPAVEPAPAPMREIQLAPAAAEQAAAPAKSWWQWATGQ